MTVKVCTRCEIPQELSAFVRDSRRPDGHTSRCLVCERARVRAWNATDGGRAYNKRRPRQPKEAKAVYDRRRYEQRSNETKARVQAQAVKGASFINSFKGSPCADCGKRFPSFCMDFDHVRGDKTLNLSRMKTHTRERIEAEIAKCELVCANCHKVRTESRRAKPTLSWKVKRRAKFDALKAAPCLDCGGAYPPEVMEFDHVRGQKVMSIGGMFSQAWERVLAEVAKCDLVCAICHRIRTETRRDPSTASVLVFVDS